MPGSSERAFLESLNSLTSMYGRDGRIYSQAFSQVFKEWCFCQYELDSIQSKDWLKCPSCSLFQHSCHVDGNCKLYRYRSSGIRRRSTYYDNYFIEEKSRVDALISTVYGKSVSSKKDSSDIMCGGKWTAARNVSRKNGSLDETGLEVATCRHQIGQKALNMMQGELFGYPIYLMKNFMVPNNVQYAFADVMCKLWKFVKRNDPLVATKLKPALSVMHAKGHSLKCQVLWDGEWLDGTGRSTGEETEQVFGYLSRCSNSTKYQRPENREETITEMMLSWNKRKVYNHASFLSKKYKRIVDELAKKKVVLNDTLNGLQISRSQFNFEEAITEIKAVASGDQSKVTLHLTEVQKFFLLYHDLKASDSVAISHQLKKLLSSYALPEILCTEFKILKMKKYEKIKLLQELEKKISLSVVAIQLAYSTLYSDHLIPKFREVIERFYYEKVHWMARLKKIGDESKQRHILRKKMSIVKANLCDCLQEYAVFSTEAVLVNECLEGRFPWTLINPTSNDNIGDADKRLLVECILRIKRSEEEKLLLVRDMESYLQFYSEKIYALKDKIELLHSGNVDVLQENIWKKYSCHNQPYLLKRKISMMKKGLAFAELQLAIGLKLFCGLVAPTLALPESVDNIQFHVDNTPNEIEAEEEVSDLDLKEEMDIKLILSTGEDLFEHLTIADCERINYEAVQQILLPSQFCQSKINNRNGINSCSIIAIIIGYFSCAFSYVNIIELVHLIVGAIEIGNILYESLNTTSLLTIHEAVSLLPEQISVEITEEENSFAHSETFRNTILQFFATSTSSHQFMVLVCNDQSFCLVKMNDDVYLIDSHSHGKYGASLSKCNYIECHKLFKTWNTIKPNDLVYSCVLTIYSN